MFRACVWNSCVTGVRIENVEIHRDLRVYFIIPCVTGVCMNSVSSDRGYEQKHTYFCNNITCVLHAVAVVCYLLQ